MFSKLNDDNFIMFAMKAYENTNCMGFSEFKEDLNRIKYIKRLLIRFKKTKKIKERLILNHIIILGNVYGPLNCCRILYFKLPENLHEYLKAFTDHLRYTPEYMAEADLDSLQADQMILDILKEVK